MPALRQTSDKYSSMNLASEPQMLGDNLDFWGFFLGGSLSPALSDQQICFLLKTPFYQIHINY